ncbi:MAG: hypothetical protein ACAI25_15000, partial [Planctomycetota bacterium]
YTVKEQRYEMGRDVGAYVRHELLGLPDRCTYWPSALKLWEKRNYRSAILTALKSAGIYKTSPGNAKAVVERLVRSVMAANPAIETRWREWGRARLCVVAASSRELGYIRANNTTREDVLNVSEGFVTPLKHSFADDQFFVVNVDLIEAFLKAAFGVR